jgi:DNA-binding MarR family transcriptional regulator
MAKRSARTSDNTNPHDTNSHGTRWLDDRERAAWMEIVVVMTKLPAMLDAQLQRDADLTHFEYGMMSMLSTSPDQTRRMHELADLTSASLSRLSHVVSRLERRGFVERTRCEGPGRATNVTLTEAGLAKVVDAAPGHVETVRRLVIDHLDDRHLDALVDIGRRLRPALDAHAP